MSEAVSENMICPKCGQFQPRAEVCSACGVVVAKLRDPAGPAPAQPPAPARADPAGPGVAADPTVPVVADSPAAPMPLAARIAAGAAAFAVVVGIGFVMTPESMGIDEFVEAKKSSFHMRNFRIEGVVESHDSFINAQSSDGRTLSSLKIAGDDTSGYVTFDPREFPAPKSGDYVSITGRFENVPYFDGSGKNKSLTMAYATSIELIKAAE